MSATATNNVSISQRVGQFLNLEKFNSVTGKISTKANNFIQTHSKTAGALIVGTNLVFITSVTYFIRAKNDLIDEKFNIQKNDIKKITLKHTILGFSSASACYLFTRIVNRMAGYQMHWTIRVALPTLSALSTVIALKACKEVRDAISLSKQIQPDESKEKETSSNKTGDTNSTNANLTDAKPLEKTGSADGVIVNTPAPGPTNTNSSTGTTSKVDETAKKVSSGLSINPFKLFGLLG